MQNVYHSGNISSNNFLVTGGAGFIGSHIVEYLLQHNAKVRVLDNLETGFLKNIEHFNSSPNFEFIKGDIRDIETCRKACDGIEYISHQAALGSVPRSIRDPLTTHEVNSTGFVNMAVAAKEAHVKKFVYASTSSVYGDHPKLPKVEEETGMALSPYAVSKKTNELYAAVFSSVYLMDFIGLRYFNVFGPRQNPDGPYAAVIPLFIRSIMNQQAACIDGDGEQTRDFSYVSNIVQANVRAMLSDNVSSLNKVYNVAVGERISINRLYITLTEIMNSDMKPKYRDSRPGDVRDSLADISRARTLLGYEPEVKVNEGLALTAAWFLTNYQR